jgi:CopG family nickel-responsive transcriptional regulator
VRWRAPTAAIYFFIRGQWSPLHSRNGFRLVAGGCSLPPNESLNHNCPLALLRWLQIIITMKKETATRFSVSLPPALLDQLDEMTAEKGYDNRSLAIADMIRAQLIEHRQKSDSGEIAGTITLVYDHHKPHLQASLTDIQHDHHDAILSTVHIHLDHHNCLEVLIVRGKASVIRKIADELIAAKGVKHGKLTVTTTGKDLPS